MKAKTARRQTRVATLEHRYRPLGTDPARCWYCHSNATGVDHVPPLMEAENLNSDAAHVLVPACWQCNKLLSVYAERRLSCRVAYLVQRTEAWLTWYHSQNAANRDYVNQRSRWTERKLEVFKTHIEQKRRLSARWTTIADELRRRNIDPKSVFAHAGKDCATMIEKVAKLKYGADFAPRRQPGREPGTPHPPEHPIAIAQRRGSTKNSKAKKTPARYGPG